jgi:hypothetical protein
MKIKTAELKGRALDWAVAKCAVIRLTEGRTILAGELITKIGPDQVAEYSSNWSFGGPIIEREGVRWNQHNGLFYAWLGGHKYIDPLHEPILDGRHPIAWRAFEYGKTLLEAAMRCHAASELGDEVEVPDELVLAEEN